MQTESDLEKISVNMVRVEDRALPRCTSRCSAESHEGGPTCPRQVAGYCRPWKHRRSECLVSPAWVPNTPSPLLLTKTYTRAYEMEGNRDLEWGRDMPSVARHAHSSSGRTELSSGKRRAPSTVPHCPILQYTIPGPTMLTQ